MNPYRVVPRAEYGLPTPVLSSNGTPRPPLVEARWITFHYTGVDVVYGDPGDTPAEIRAIERWAASQSKPNEYNYVIGQDPDELVYEYAGAFRAAHSAGENSDAVGVLFLNGTREPLTDAQVDKFRWLRDAVLIPFKVLSARASTTPHREMPGAETTCPGPLILARRPDLEARWQAPPAPTPPPVPPGATGEVLLTRVEPGDGWWSIARRVYGLDNVRSNAQALEDANANGVLRPGQLINVPGRAVR